MSSNYSAKFSEEEDKRIIELWPYESAINIGFELKRSHATIKRRALELELPPHSIGKPLKSEIPSSSTTTSNIRANLARPSWFNEPNIEQKLVGRR